MLQKTIYNTILPAGLFGAALAGASYINSRHNIAEKKSDANSVFKKAQSEVLKDQVEPLRLARQSYNLSSKSDDDLMCLVEAEHKALRNSKWIADGDRVINPFSYVRKIENDIKAEERCRAEDLRSVFIYSSLAIALGKGCLQYHGNSSAFLCAASVATALFASHSYRVDESKGVLQKNKIGGMSKIFSAALIVGLGGGVAVSAVEKSFAK